MAAQRSPWGSPCPASGRPGAARGPQTPGMSVAHVPAKACMARTPRPVQTARARTIMRFDQYEVGDFFDEMFGENGRPRASARTLAQNLGNLPEGELVSRQRAAERALLHMGIIFNVYGERAGLEKIFPFDLVPRIVSVSEWSRIERGLKQRITALNLFINDFYHDQKILKDGVLPAGIVLSSKVYRKACAGFNLPRGIWCHIIGTDLVRHRDGQIYVLEDNL